MRKKYLALPLSALLLLLAGHVAAEENFTAAASDDMLDLYFTQDQLVESATRAPKPMRQVAENVTIITAEEIQRMNARNVADILNRVNGVFVQFNGQDFNEISSFHTHNSDYEQVLVLLDGVRWNFDPMGMAITHSIPVEIIDRLEVIKGPASSTWGSSLGGVVNIVTKKTGNTTRPGGTVSASYGEANSQRYSGTVAGKTGPAGYFLSVKSETSDGISLNRAYDNESVYGKINLDLPGSSVLTLTSSYSEPKLDLGDVFAAWVAPQRYTVKNRDFWATATLETALSESASLTVSAFHKEQNYIYPHSGDYTGAKSNGINARTVVSKGRHTFVVGGDFDRIKGDDIWEVIHERDETWGLFTNDTITLGDFTVIPGIRYDHLSNSDNMVSPSLGMTWQFSDHSLFRAQIARGFKKMYLYDVAQDLDLEKVTSYQAGIETSAVPFMNIKASLFQHDGKDSWELDSTTWYNAPKRKRYGYEIEVATLPFHHFSLNGGFTYVYTDYYGALSTYNGVNTPLENDDQYSAKITLLYDNPDLCTVELFGQYLHWDDDRTDAKIGYEYYDKTMIWDLNATKPLQLSEHTSMDIFLSVHNLFDGRHYWSALYENSSRWVEGGVRFHF